MSNTLEAKIVILGSQGVGKTSLVYRYVNQTFPQNSTSTIGAALMSKNVTVDHCKVKLQIWDTAGQERFRQMAPMYYRGAHAALVVYDITSKETFVEMREWVKELQEKMQVEEPSQEMMIVIVGNKTDLEGIRAVTSEIAKKEVKELLRDKAPIEEVYHEVSAKEGQGIDELFLQIIKGLVESRQHRPQRKKAGTVIIEEDSPADRTWCWCN